METKRVDLHIHSTCSDGYFSPEELVEKALEAGLSAISIADHDNVDGIAVAQKLGAEKGLEVLAGVELSTQWYEYYDMHLLGYGFDPQDPYLNRELSEFQEFRAGRNRQIIDRVNEKLAGEGRAPLDPQAVRRLAGGTIGRPHIAQALRAAGYVADNEEAFNRYLVPCNVPKRYFPVDEAIRLIQQSGGVAVLAHPPYITRERRLLEKLVVELVGLGLDGIEVYNNGSNMEDTDWLIKLAREHELIITGGSDFHGDPGSNIEIGSGFREMKVPYRCVDEIKSALRKRQL
ncbi:PHP domain-containing protein [Malonomonas rubra]|uniref:PHP domain-containing protein n=1 Tax=Malonomonas rubra TaxID=57040 RepID=UPI0026ECEDDC|nr:PHP domain-containing protein [Malonomonas rubra]